MDRASRTAERVAERRAAHQLLDKPVVFDDPLALAIVDRDAALRDQSPLDPFFRAAFAARSRFAEDQLGEAYRRGVRQYIVLGAGFGTFAYRNPFAGLRVLEVEQSGDAGWEARAAGRRRDWGSGRCGRRTGRLGGPLAGGHA